MKINKFPKNITVTIDRESDEDDDYLIAHCGTDVVGHTQMGETTKVGVYELVEVREVTGVASSRKISQ